MSDSQNVNGITDHFAKWWPLWFAAILTVTFVFWAWSLALEVTVEGGISARRWDHFLGGRPNELGDTLAGFVGSLTLIWVIASVFQQSMELRAQRHEFEEMANAMGQQVEAMQAQSDLLNFQRDALEQNQAREALERGLVLLVDGIRGLNSIKHWEILSPIYDGDEIIGQDWKEFPTSAFAGGNTVDDRLAGSLRLLRMLKRNLADPSRTRPREGKKSAAKAEFEKLFPMIDRCLQTGSRLHEVEQLRLKNLELSAIREVLNDLMNMDLWDENGFEAERFKP